jgi:lysophospholipase L1-like esterase
LRERLSGAPVECINAGLPGATLFQGWRFLETRGWSLEPDVIVLNFGWNESADWDARGDLEFFELWNARLPPRALRGSSLARFLWSRRAIPKPDADLPKRARLSSEEFRGLLARCREEAKRRNLRCLVLVGASRANFDPRNAASARSPLQRIQLESGESLDGVAVLQELAREHAPDELFFDGVHTRAVANRALAEALSERILPWLAGR